MYCSNCDSYIPAGLDLKVCPSCEIDIVNVAVPREKRNAVIRVEEPPPLPPPVEEKGWWKKPKNITSPALSVSEKSKRPRSRTEYHLTHGMILSFFSPSFYVDVALRWRGACMAHLVLVVIMVTLFFTLWLNDKYSTWNDEYIYPVVDKFPSIAVEGNKLMMLEKSPYVLMGPEGTVQRVIFDAAGTVSANQLTTEWLAGPSAVFFKDPQQMLKTIPYDEEVSFKLNREIVHWASEQFRRWLPFLTYFIIGGVYWIFLIASAFLYSLAGIVIHALAKTALGYPAIFRLAAVAVTPSALSEAVLRFFLDVETPWLSGLFFFVPFAYLILGVSAVRLFLTEQARQEAERAAREQKKGLFHGIIRP